MTSALPMIVPRAVKNPRTGKPSGQKPTFSPERRLSGGEQTYFRQVLKVRVVP